MVSEDFSELKEFLLVRGFVVIKIEKREPNEYRVTLLNVDNKDYNLGDKFYLTFENCTPEPIFEFLNTCEEIHALGFGLIHSFKMLNPIPYAELKEREDLSPDLIKDLENEYHYYLVGFWGLRILVAIILIIVTDTIDTAAHLLGW